MARGRRSHRGLSGLLLLVVALLPEAAHAQVATVVNRATPIAVIVNRTNAVSDIRLEDLRRYYLGSNHAFPDGSSVVLLEFPPARRAFYRSLLHMSELAVTRHWIGVVFRGEEANPLRGIDGAEALKRTVAEIPGALGFINAAAVDTTVKVVTVDGRHPQDSGYPLR
jgi:hypothetical protein